MFKLFSHMQVQAAIGCDHTILTPILISLPHSSDHDPNPGSCMHMCVCVFVLPCVFFLSFIQTETVCASCSTYHKTMPASVRVYTAARPQPHFLLSLSESKEGDLQKETQCLEQQKGEDEKTIRDVNSLSHDWSGGFPSESC